MRTVLLAIVERDLETGLLVASVPGLPGAHTQGATFEEARENLKEVVKLLAEGAAIKFESEFIGTIAVTAT